MLAHPMMICMPHKRITIDKGKKPQCNKGLVSIPSENGSPCKKHFFSNNIEVDGWSCESAIQGQFLK